MCHLRQHKAFSSSNLKPASHDSQVGFKSPMILCSLFDAPKSTTLAGLLSREKCVLHTLHISPHRPGQRPEKTRGISTQNARHAFESNARKSKAQNAS